MGVDGVGMEWSCGGDGVGMGWRCGGDGKRAIATLSDSINSVLAPTNLLEVGPLEIAHPCSGSFLYRTCLETKYRVP